MADEPQAFFYQATGDHISEPFERLLISMEERLPVYEFREWHKSLQAIARLGQKAKEFSERLNVALLNDGSRATHRWYRAIALITLLQTTIAGRQRLDARLVNLYAGPTGKQDAREILANLLDELYAGEAEKNIAGPAAFHRVARSALLITGLDEQVTPALARYLKWLGVAERAIAAGSASETAKLELTAVLKEMEALLEGREATLREARRQSDELRKEVDRMSGANDKEGLKRVLAQQEQLGKALEQMLSQSGNEVGSPRVVQYLRTRMGETLKGETLAAIGNGVQPTSFWGWLCLHFGGVPDRMVSWGWVNLTLLMLAVLLGLPFILGLRPW